ncbi:MAG TPA: response regulator [Candidatus Saccharimonadales bacterium]|nr:response regulator [Candidatus Saccharimonadales bacterium]
MDSLLAVFVPAAPFGTLPDMQYAMKNILVIDDTADLRNLIATILSNFGFTVREAANGHMGLQMIHDEKPDLVVCDINMPGMDGYETLATMRESADAAAIPFILMTGLVSRDGFRRGMVSGADDYLVKPFTPDELVEAVMSRLVRQADVQLEADKRAKRFHDYASVYPFPELSGELTGNSGMALA